jgi:hypothetical protein
MTLPQEIVASLIFLITEILVIEDHNLDNTFLYVAFESQSLLKPTRLTLIPIKGPDKTTREG